MSSVRLYPSLLMFFLTLVCSVITDECKKCEVMLVKRRCMILHMLRKHNINKNTSLITKLQFTHKFNKSCWSLLAQLNPSLKYKECHYFCQLPSLTHHKNITSRIHRNEKTIYLYFIPFFSVCTPSSKMVHSINLCILRPVILHNNEVSALVK